MSAKGENDLRGGSGLQLSAALTAAATGAAAPAAPHIGGACKKAIEAGWRLVRPGHGLKSLVIVADDAHCHHVLALGAVRWPVKVKVKVKVRWPVGTSVWQKVSGQVSTGGHPCRYSPSASPLPLLTQAVKVVATSAMKEKMRKLRKLGIRLISIATPPNTSAHDLGQRRGGM